MTHSKAQQILSNYTWQEDYSASWELAHRELRKRGMLRGKYPPNDDAERLFLDWYTS